ncbi:YeaH/YhbH family protein [Ruegeria arenilitoris]|uniref:YeaH/YhbH family protein n=1 Tax=Ruegeria arenilitoris TaxID=1173585 RepID=UPI001479B0B6|nr:YeaH/YhbH family protein [Ruegeria arenilitoris]
MAHFIDRRLNPKDKNLGNRRRFLRRVRSAVKEAVDESVRRRKIADVDQQENISVSSEGIGEPHFQHDRQGGSRHRVLTGNKTFKAGDRLKKPPSGQDGQGGREGAPDGEGEDEFMFVLSRDEFLSMFFEDLELPDMVKRSLKEVAVSKPHRMGYTAAGTPANLSVSRTMRNAFGRRLAMRRPTNTEIQALTQQVEELEALEKPDAARKAERQLLREQLDKMLRRRKIIPYIDPLDVRYKYFEMRPEPAANAVMFCLMDVSASMGEREKSLAKQFFVLLHLFLKQRYDKIELVFIRHTQIAAEVDEDTFFHSRQTGGTVVSSALNEMKKIIEARYPSALWNIYAAQASDGENFSGDSQLCADLLNSELMKWCQYFAYTEIVDETEANLMNSADNGMELWRSYRQVAEAWPNFAMKRIARASDIYPVLHELFARKTNGVSNG